MTQLDIGSDVSDIGKRFWGVSGGQGVLRMSVILSEGKNIATSK